MTDFNKETSEQKVQRLIGLSKREKIGLGLLLVYIILAPIIFTQFSSLCGFNEKTGVIGDTIGGVTAPFVNLLAAYLVYKSFTAQIRANSQQRNDHDKQMLQLKKEHSFNYISNSYNLIKDKYGVLESDSQSDTSHIWNVFHSADALIRTEKFSTLNNPVNFKTKEERESHVYKKKLSDVKSHADLINSNINGYLLSIENQSDTLLLFNDESENSGLEEGIKSFYRVEVEKIFFAMNLNALYDGRWITHIEKTKDYLTTDNMFKIKNLKSKAEKMVDKGYRLSKK